MLNNKIILGTAQLGLNYGINNTIGKPSLEESLEILHAAQDFNISFLDTAEAYGNAEEIIGIFHKNSEEKFNIISKFSQGIDLESKINNSLKNLNINQLFAYLFHKPNELFNNIRISNELTNLKNQGLIKYIGISIYSNDEFEAAINSELIDLIQIPFNLLDNKNLRGNLIDKAKANNKIIHTRSAFLQGLFFKSLNQLPSKLSILHKYLDIIQQISLDNNISIRELAISYVLNNTSVDGIVMGVDSLKQLKENISALNEIEKNQMNYNSYVEKIVVKEIELLNPINW